MSGGGLCAWSTHLTGGGGDEVDRSGLIGLADERQVDQRSVQSPRFPTGGFEFFNCTQAYRKKEDGES
jgi:hypothetical protein